MDEKIQPEKIRVPYGLSVHGQEEIDAVVKVLQGNTALGEKTKEFEAKIAALFGKKYGVMVNSGSSANLLAFELLNLEPGSEVITPILTFATTVAPMIQKGLVPVFIDVDQNTYLINIDEVEKAITAKTKALMIPSLLGNIPNLERLAALADKYHLWLIEDSCDTLGGKYKNRPTGEYSHITTTSFYGSHIINGAGGGGMICVNNPEWVDRLVVLRGWGRQSSLFGEKADSEILANRFRETLDGIPYDNKFIFSAIGYNFLPLELSAAFALEQLKKFPRFAQIRQANFAKLYQFFQNFSEFFILPEQTPDTETVWLALPLIIKETSPFSRLELITFLEENNIQTRPVFTGNILKQPGFKNIPHRLAQDSFPSTERIMNQAFVVACHQGLVEEQINYLKDKFIEFLNKYKTPPGIIPLSGERETGLTPSSPLLVGGETDVLTFPPKLFTDKATAPKPMKTIILCGGQGTRMKEETEFKPKPLVLVGGKPILWHIMKIYAHYGYNDFILALGYKSNMIKEYFLHWRTLLNDFTLNTKNNELIFHNNDCDDFKITFVETGLESLTGERVRRLKNYIGTEDFMLTYGDGLADINIKELVAFHERQNTIGTITGVYQKSRYGLITADQNTKKIQDFYQTNVKDFDNAHSHDLINGGFMVFKNQALDLIKENSMIEQIFVPLSARGELSIFFHEGFWKSMDTYKEVEEMNEIWKNNPFWKNW